MLPAWLVRPPFPPRYRLAQIGRYEGLRQPEGVGERGERRPRVLRLENFNPQPSRDVGRGGGYLGQEAAPHFDVVGVLPRVVGIELAATREGDPVVGGSGTALTSPVRFHVRCVPPVCQLRQNPPQTPYYSHPCLPATFGGLKG